MPINPITGEWEDDEDIAEVVINADRSPVDNSRLQAAQDAALESHTPDIAAPTMGKSQILPGLKDDRVRQLIAKRIQEKQDDERGKLVQGVQDTDSSILGNIFAGISGFGAGVRGADVGTAFKQAKDIQMSGANRALSEFDKKTQLDREKTSDEREGKVFERGERDDADKQRVLIENRDPKSERSQFAQFVLTKMMPSIKPETVQRMSAELIAERFPQVNAYIENEYRKSREAAAAEERKADNDRSDRHHTDNLAARKDEAAARRAEAGALRAIAAGNRSQDRGDKFDWVGEVNVKDPREYASVGKIGGLSDFRNDAKKLADNGVLAQNVGLLDSFRSSINEAVKGRSKTQAQVVALKGKWEKLMRQDWKSEPNGQITQERLSQLTFPQNDGEIPVFLEEIENILDGQDPDGRYENAYRQLQARKGSSEPATIVDIVQRGGKLWNKYSDGTYEEVK